MNLPEARRRISQVKEETDMKAGPQPQNTRSWTTRRDEKQRHLKLTSSWMNGPLLPREKLVESLGVLLAPGDRIVLEGDNQKQADFLSRSLVKVDPKKLHDLHLIISSISRPEQLTLFELGIAKSCRHASGIYRSQQSADLRGYA
jgi:malonate decarboxylase alpha subunit